ncbi:hypothetical protein [Pseudorhodoferax sp. Leaf274]|uniref:hypothetical protein n=1 Tax=Pseudorhodoferax sp. Leaf274 TaxID=1736318 RepID=UPI0007038CDA|nr:hypothetical protein [Pseudorhodoferax sp. Leaf274]KQP38867.1 hypothetical protein ASF44_10510 [Pseudorhodoferax sp. Leaf274]
MATPKSLKRLQSLIWILIYAGLLTLVLGLAVTRYDEPLGTWLAGCGGAVAAVGFMLIFVRARLKPNP